MSHQYAPPNWFTTGPPGARLRGRFDPRVPALATAALLCIGVACSPSSTARPNAGSEPIPLPVRCATLPATPDTVTRPVYAVLEAPLRRDSLPRVYTALVLEAIRQGFLLPRPLTLTVMGPADTRPEATPDASSHDQERLTPVAFGEIEMTLDRAGTVHDVHLAQSSQSSALDKAFYAAPARADSLRLFPTLDVGAGSAPAHLFIAMQMDQPRTGRWAPLFNIRVPVWRDAHSAFPLTVTRVVVEGKVPDTKNGRVVDSVAMMFVVNESGRAVPGTFRLIHGRYREFARAAAQGMQSERYFPAVIAGCAASGLLTTTTVYQVGQ